jgi:transposase
VDPVSWTLDGLGRKSLGSKDVQMPRTRPPYSSEFRREAVELIRSGTPLKQVAADLGVSEQTLRNWRRHGDIDAGRAEGLTTEEHEELRRVRRLRRRWTRSESEQPHDLGDVWRGLALCLRGVGFAA